MKIHDDAIATRLWNGRAIRHDRHGGPVSIPEDKAAMMDAHLKSAGQDPALAARICLDGVERGEFLIITDPAIRQFAERRHEEVNLALKRLDERMIGYAANGPERE